MVPKNESSKILSAGSLVKAFGGIQLAPQGHLELHTESIELIGVNIILFHLRKNIFHNLYLKTFQPMEN